MEMNGVRKGLVYSIQRYCIHDGPGIRTDFFFKGCSLRCPWCSNPESQAVHPEIAFMAHKCTGCGACYQKCTRSALRWDDPVRVDREKCDLCGLCVKYCVRDCYKIYGQYYTAEELYAEALKDELFYRNSKGGITVTGGEPMMQFDFVKEFLALCTEKNLNTAMETHGFNPPDKYAEIAPYVDHFLIDLKHTDLHKCHEVTNSPLCDSPMENIRMLADELGKTVSIRIPVIPGFNDDKENFRRVAEFAGSLKYLFMINLMPYHNMGAAKYATLDKNYGMNTVHALDDKAVEPYRDALLAAGLPCMIGG